MNEPKPLPWETRNALRPLSDVMRLVRFALASRIGRGVGVNAFDKLVVTVLQLISVPIFVTKWGLEAYGIWLLLFTVPSYLSLADFGLASAAGNEMTMQFARGDKDAALAVFQSAWVMVCALSLALFAIAVLTVLTVPLHLLATLNMASRNHAEGTILALMCYGLLILQGGIFQAGFRSVGNYALGAFCQALIMLIENLAVFIIVLGDGGLFAAALTYLAVRALGTISAGALLKRRAGWLMVSVWSASPETMRRVFNPARAVIALTAAQAVSLQGTVAAVGLAGGAHVVPAFTVVRTLSRLGLQLVWVVNNAVMPEFTMAYARGHIARQAQLAAISFSAALIILLPLSLLIVVEGRELIEYWTRGLVQPQYALVFTMALVTITNGAWWPIATLIFATNRHSQFSYFYLVMAIGSVLLSYPLVRLVGPTGAAISLLLLDVTMLARTWLKAQSSGVLDLSEVRRALVRLWANSLSQVTRRYKQT